MLAFNGAILKRTETGLLDFVDNPKQQSSRPYALEKQTPCSYLSSPPNWFCHLLSPQQSGPGIQQLARSLFTRVMTDPKSWDLTLAKFRLT